MRRPIVYILLTLLAGVAAGALRALEYHLAWDRELGLMARWHPASLGLIALCAAFFCAALLLSPRRASPSGQRMAQPKHMPVYLAADIVAALALFAAAAYDLRRYWEESGAKSVSLIVFALLTLFTALSVLLIMRAAKRGALGRAYGFYMTVPVFWACYWLVLEFSQNAANPVILSYAYEMLGIIFIVLSLYSMAGFFFNLPRLSKAIFYSMMGALFSMVTVLGPVLARLFWGEWPTESHDWAQYLRFLFAVIHLLASVYILRGQKIEIYTPGRRRNRVKREEGGETPPDSDTEA